MGPWLKICPQSFSTKKTKCGESSYKHAYGYPKCPINSKFDPKQKNIAIALALNRCSYGCPKRPPLNLNLTQKTKMWRYQLKTRWCSYGCPKRPPLNLNLTQKTKMWRYQLKTRWYSYGCPKFTHSIKIDPKKRYNLNSKHNDLPKTPKKNAS